MIKYLFGHTYSRGDGILRVESSFEEFLIKKVAGDLFYWTPFLHRVDYRGKPAKDSMIVTDTTTPEYVVYVEGNNIIVIAKNAGYFIGKSGWRIKTVKNILSLMFGKPVNIKVEENPKAEEFFVVHSLFPRREGSDDRAKLLCKYLILKYSSLPIVLPPPEARKMILAEINVYPGETAEDLWKQYTQKVREEYEFKCELKQHWTEVKEKKREDLEEHEREWKRYMEELREEMRRKKYEEMKEHFISAFNTIPQPPKPVYKTFIRKEEREETVWFSKRDWEGEKGEKFRKTHRIISVEPEKRYKGISLEQLAEEEGWDEVPRFLFEPTRLRGSIPAHEPEEGEEGFRVKYIDVREIKDRERIPENLTEIQDWASKLTEDQVKAINWLHHYVYGLMPYDYAINWLTYEDGLAQAGEKPLELEKDPVSLAHLFIAVKKYLEEEYEKENKPKENTTERIISREEI